MRKLIAVLLGIALIASACGGDDNGTEDVAAAGDGAEETDAGGGDAAVGDDTAEPSDEPADAADDGEANTDEGNPPSPGGGGGGDLCTLGAEFEANETFTNLTILDGEEFFVAMGDAWRRAAAAAPGDLQDDVAVITEGFDEMEAVFAQYDYNVFDPDLQAAFEDFDTTAMDSASDAFNEYLNDACGIEISTAAPAPDASGPVGIDPEDLENLDFDDPVTVLTQLFGLDEETARCINDELGGFDENTIDPSTINDPICGTTLLEVITGLGG